MYVVYRRQFLPVAVIIFVCAAGKTSGIKVRIRTPSIKRTTITSLLNIKTAG